MLFRVFCGCGLALILAGCYPKATPLTTPTNEAASSQSSATENDSEDLSEYHYTAAGVDVGTALREDTLPSQSTVLIAEDPDTQINIRASPGTEATVVDVGFVGDAVTVSRLAKAEDGYDWYYLQLNVEESGGWVREDFVDVVRLSTTPTFAQEGGEADALSPALDHHCGGLDGIETYYRTVSFITYICRSRDRPIYLSNEIGTSQVLVTEEVKSLPGDNFGYIARHDNYEYHISRTGLVVYRADERGDLIRVLQERVTLAEQY